MILDTEEREEKEIVDARKEREVQYEIDQLKKPLLE